MNEFWSLPAVKEYISNDDYEFWAPAECRSVGAVISVFQDRGVLMKYKDAADYIIDGIKQLDEGDYVSSLLMWEIKCDVYGKVIDDIPWYIKFSMCDDEGKKCLAQISFHPIEKEGLKTRSGNELSVYGGEG